MHHLSRQLKALAHDARLMPANMFRPSSKCQKNDFRDAKDIAEAVQRPTMNFVAIKTAEQRDLQALHRVRERLLSQRTGIIARSAPFFSIAASPCTRGASTPRRATHPGSANRCPVTPDGADYRGSRRRLAAAR